MARRRLPAALGRRTLVVASLGDWRTLRSDARRAAREGADLIEVRVDLFPRAQRRPDPLRRLLEAVRAAGKRRIIVTVRRGEEGGGLPVKMPESDRLALYRSSLADADGVDVELGAGDINRHVVFEAHKRGLFVILSAHRFKGTPSNAALAGLVRKARSLRADVLKIAARPSRAADVDRFMDFCARTPFRRRVFIPMGRWGRAARENGSRWGSCLTYGYVRRPLAPGQLSVKRLAEIVRAPEPEATAPRPR